MFQSKLIHIGGGNAFRPLLMATCICASVCFALIERWLCRGQRCCCCCCSLPTDREYTLQSHTPYSPNTRTPPAPTEAASDGAARILPCDAASTAQRTFQSPSLAQRRWSGFGFGLWTPKVHTLSSSLSRRRRSTSAFNSIPPKSERPAAAAAAMSTQATFFLLLASQPRRRHSSQARARSHQRKIETKGVNSTPAQPAQRVSGKSVGKSGDRLRRGFPLFKCELRPAGMCVCVCVCVCVSLFFSLFIYFS